MKMTDSRLSRRSLLKQGMLAAAVIPSIGVMCDAMAAGLPPLDPADPTAKALSYSNDSSTVDASTHPTHKPDQSCGTCAQYQGKPSDARGGCNIFAGKSVSSGGWCTVWAKKPG
jgi:High potential iron-sulfur protein